ncbi:MAG TPA: helix-turn-helix transcriptional regulator [Streptosporangiaceae bacterium]|jgi:DNA-binding CsgD family transcriptional regulator|nr:helix-turn-helix transcriptional regulator [Streptosporangiaceae bacterium]
MTAPVTVSEKDLRTLLGIVQDTRDDLPDAGLPVSLLTELTDQIRCDNLSLLGAEFLVARKAESWEQEIPPTDLSGIDEMATEGFNWIEFTGYPDLSGDLRSVTKVSDFYSARQWHSTVAYTDAFRHLGMGEHVLQLCLPGQLGPAAWPFCGGAKMLIFRGPGPDFSDRDRDLLALLQPHLNQAYLDAERRRCWPPPLTPRQRELMRLIAAGHTNAKIARQLGITEGTVRSHLQDIYTRLQVSNRAAAVARAFPAGAPLQPQR